MYSDHVLQDSPFAYWPMQEASGLTMKDVVGGKIFTWDRATRAVADSGIVGPVDKLSTLGSNTLDSYATCAFSWAPTDFSVEWWIKPNTAANNCAVVASTTITSGGSWWGTFAFHGSGLPSGPNYGPYTGTDVATRFVPADNPGAWLIGVWNHIVCTYTASGSTFRLYRNGAFVNSKTVTAPASWPGMVLGSDTLSTGMDGWIAHLALHPQALPAARIAARYREALRGGVSY